MRSKLHSPLAAFALLALAALAAACIPFVPAATTAPTADATAAPAVPPTPLPTATPAGCTETSGSIERVAVPSALLEGTLWVSVYTPPCYSAQPETPYPVLYLLHGQGQDDSLWPNMGLQAIVDEAIVAGQAPFLIVMPFEERNFDAVGDSKFPAAVMEELLPWVEANYPVCTERACRAIGGISRGGGWAVHIALRNFETFGTVGAHSMGLMPGDWWYVGHLLETHTASEFPRIYMDRGENDYLAEDIDLFESALTNGGIAHEFHLWPGQHELAYWQAHIADYLHWYMQGWQ